MCRHHLIASISAKTVFQDLTIAWKRICRKVYGWKPNKPWKVNSSCWWTCCWRLIPKVRHCQSLSVRHMSLHKMCERGLWTNGELRCEDFPKSGMWKQTSVQRDWSHEHSCFTCPNIWSQTLWDPSAHWSGPFQHKWEMNIHFDLTFLYPFAEVSATLGARSKFGAATILEPTCTRLGGSSVLYPSSLICNSYVRTSFSIYDYTQNYIELYMQ